MASNQNTATGKNDKPAFKPGQFIDETRREIAKVSWPTRKETVTTTFAIVVMALAFGVFFFGVDNVIGYVVSHLLGMVS